MSDEIIINRACICNYEDLKCCGNCELHEKIINRKYLCYYFAIGETNGKKYCKHWIFDGLTQKEREICH